ncbi:MAG: hypothetical protein HFE90_00900 [Firmicutes bacterium]|nr:hypothetical protein [Bacillota bacterium]
MHFEKGVGAEKNNSDYNIFKREWYMNKIRIRIRKVICQNVKERNSISNKFNREGYEKGGIKIPGGEEKLTVKVNIANVDGILI